MKEFTVTYSLGEEELERLRRIEERYKERWPDLTEKELFERIMQAGSRNDIGRKFLKHEKKLGLTGVT